MKMNIEHIYIKSNLPLSTDGNSSHARDYAYPSMMLDSRQERLYFESIDGDLQIAGQ